MNQNLFKKMFALALVGLVLNGCGDDDIDLSGEDGSVSVDGSDGSASVNGGGTSINAGGDSGAVVSVPADNFPASGTSTSFFIPDNCSNPPTQISSNDGFQCISSRTRNNSLVCLLPFQFTWPPLQNFTDDAGFTFGCNANGDFFDSVTLVLSDGQSIPLAEAGCFNFVATADGPIGRQHWRSESTQFSSVQNRLSMMIMTRDGQDTCLRF